MASKPIFSLDVVDESLKHRVPVTQHSRGPEMVTHLYLDLGDFLIFWAASSPLAAWVPRIEWQLIVGPRGRVMAMLFEPIKDVRLIVQDWPKYPDQMTFGRRLIACLDSQRPAFEVLNLNGRDLFDVAAMFIEAVSKLRPLIDR